MTELTRLAAAAHFDADGDRQLRRPQAEKTAEPITITAIEPIAITVAANALSLFMAGTPYKPSGVVLVQPAPTDLSHIKNQAKFPANMAGAKQESPARAAGCGAGHSSQDMPV